jgi:DNA polymerase-3 subunit delta'
VEPAPLLLPWQGDVLRRALTLQRDRHLPHAVLLHTPSGRRIGDLALYLSMLMLCDRPDDLAFCGSCEACRMMSAGTYADFSRVTLEVDDKAKKLNKNIKIEQIRNLIHELSLTRKYDRLKIAVIYPAETMNKSSANALLKTLEEPSPHVLLILLTHTPGRIPITLRSRCQLWTIHRPALEQSLQWLQTQGLDADSAAQYLQFAAADPLLALQLRQQDFAQLVDSFKSRLSAFLRGKLGVSELGKGLLESETASARRLLEMTLSAYCYQASGVDGAAAAKTTMDAAKARQLLDLRARAQRQLQVEENNLDFQIQLEDVLISLKQILTRRLN